MYKISAGVICTDIYCDGRQILISTSKKGLVILIMLSEQYPFASVYL